MENYIRCPACDSTRIRERHIGKKTVAVAGGVSGALAGASIGSAVPVVGTIAGAAVGALFGRLVAGATAGAVSGSALDGVVFDRYECIECEYTFD
ncbi:MULTISPECIES: hypothetical protein [Morganellaceae]|uniref:hypothetical protein n=1 Tax=Morganellaceae TaxID=1903414 RepID=UPI001B363BED|nr:hypothetical protein [Proteus mirabilis]MBQ0521893.1 hypothetical protein [Proteus mirabilis]